MATDSFIDRFLEVINDVADGKQNRFATLINTSQQNVNNWLNKGRFPTEEAFKNIGSLGVNVHWLITGEGEKHIETDKENKPLSAVKAAELILNLERANEESRGQIETSLAEALKEQGKEYIRLDQQIGKG